nr:PREDICTED: uncharacterized protein LOC103280055 [Anolis carolinensis]|eukprot:XP_008115990.1 PREDICTED: uncharacterized protein LOC103280055 [Anolis carolinensis]
MATQKGRMEDRKVFERRNSLPGDPNLKDIMKELQKITENQRSFQEQMLNIQRDLSEELIGMKKEMKDIQKSIKEIKQEEHKMEKKQDKLERKIDILEMKNAKLEARQEKIEQKELDLQIRIRNLPEEPRENLKLVITQLLADLIQITDEEMEENIDRTFRITTNFSKKNHVPRDAIVQFSKRKVREEVLKSSSKNTIRYKGEKVTILKEFPTSTIQKRRKYLFLTEELKKRQIKFRWERREGIMTTYKEERFWLTTEDKAKDFYEKLMEETVDPIKTGQDSERKRKKPRMFSPEKTETNSPTPETNSQTQEMELRGEEAANQP